MAGRHRIEMEPGARYGRLTVIGYEGRQLDSVYRCVCDCGRETVVSGYLLRSGRTSSCGCLQKERTAEARRAKAEARRAKAEAEARKRALRERMLAARRRKDHEARMMAYNQRAGERFDDWWMFGDEKAVKRLRKMFR